MALAASPARPLMAERRRSSRLIAPKTPRFWPEMKKTRRGCGASLAPISLVEVGALDLAAGELLGIFIRIAGQCSACSTNWPPGARALVVTIATGEILRFEARFPAENPTPHQAFAG
jgi:hypothetical protein